MKIRGVCVDILCEIDPIYRDYTVTEGNQKVLYVHITQAIYGMLISAMLLYHKLTKALLSYGYIMSKSCISHNCFLIIVFLYSQKVLGNNNPILYYQSTVIHLLTWPIKTHHYGRDWEWIMTLLLLELT